MKLSPWESFLKEKVELIFKNSESVLDIGGGLRINESKNNRKNSQIYEWVSEYVGSVDYRVSDVVDTYKPDLVLDVQNIELEDNSQEAVVCLSVLEHVENPFKSAKEIHRIIRKGGYCLVYVPFLYYYHAESGYYKDYWRFTQDSLRLIFKDFSQIEIKKVRGALETWLHISPLGRISILRYVFRFLDKVSGKLNSDQVSGHYVFLVK